MARTSKGSRSKTLQQIQTPLGFYVLALLIIESTLGIVLTAARFDQQYKWFGFLCMIGVFAAVVAIVTALTAWKPKNLLYGKEEHSIPQIEPSALRDQIEDIIFERVRPECLNLDQGGEAQT
jgi:MFS superfamily sulfate permease-like transporter